MRISTVVVGAGLLAGGVALGAAYHVRPKNPPPNPDLTSSSPIVKQPDSTPVEAASPPNAATDGRTAADTSVRVEMKNVNFHLTDKIVVHIASLEGKLIPNGNVIPVFDDKKSFSLEASSADVTISTRSLTNDLNDFVFAKPDAPLKGLEVSTEGNEMVIKGRLASKGDLPFESDGVPSITPDGMIRIHTVRMKALHVPLKRVMDSIGLHASNLLGTTKVNGVSVDHDDLILDPQKILPPPAIRGRLASIRVQANALALEFRSSSPDEATAVPFATTCGGQNFLDFKGGTVRFGNLTMNDTDLELLDSTPADPFDFSIDHYQKQLVSGFSTMTDKGGLCVHMPDLDKIQASGNGKFHGASEPGE